MADLIGPQPIPIADLGIGPGARAGDPLLDVLGSFYKAVLDARAGAAWAALAPDSTAPASTACRKVFTWDPEPAGQEFLDRELPALFIWRDHYEPASWLAAGWRTRQSALRLAWVFPPVDQKRQSARAPFINALASVFDQSLEFKGRDPAWVYPGDPDPDAATLGSNLWVFAKLFRIVVGRVSMSPLIIRGPVGTTGVAPKTYFRVQVQIDVWERLEQDLSAWYDLEDGLDVDALANPDLEIAHPLFYIAPTLTGVTPATGTSAGGTAVTLAGDSFRTGALVDFDGVQATSVVVVDSTQITAVTPAHAAGFVDVTVTDPNGSTATLADAFAYT